MYKVNLSDKTKLVVACGGQTHELIHGEVFHALDVVKAYPKFFVEVQEAKAEVVTEKVKVEESKEEILIETSSDVETTEEVVEEVLEAEPKKTKQTRRYNRKSKSE